MIVNQILAGLSRIIQEHEKVPGLLLHPCGVWMRSNASALHQTRFGSDLATPTRFWYRFSHEFAPSGRSQRACARTARKAISYQFKTDATHEPNLDAQAFPRLLWGICPDFRHRAPQAYRTALLGFRSMDRDTFTVVPGLVENAEVIAVGKFPAGSRPFLYRHLVGKGTVYVNTWTTNIYRDCDARIDFGGWEYDFFLDLAAETAGIEQMDITGGAALWLRNTWGYHWKEM